MENAWKKSQNAIFLKNWDMNETEIHERKFSNLNFLNAHYFSAKSVQKALFPS